MSGAPIAPQGHWTEAEIRGRIERAQGLMGSAGLDALLVTSPVNFSYLSGVHSDFFVSPTRPWYLVVPAAAEPIAVVPEVAAVAMAASSPIADLRSWPSPRPADDGITLLADALRQATSPGGRIGAEIGPETRLGMPVGDFQRLAAMLGPDRVLAADGGVLRDLRMIKSPAEIEALRRISQAVSEAYEALTGLIEPGHSERDVAAILRREALLRGAHQAPFLSVTSAPVCYRDGYEILNAAHRRLQAGDCLFIDSGFTRDGYFCDFNRSWAIGEPAAKVEHAYQVVHAATEAGIAAAQPDVPLREVFAAMAAPLAELGGLASGSRMGHGLGLDLTEPPSITAEAETVLRPGMVMTIEPGAVFGDSYLMVEEEAIVIGESGNELLTKRASASIPVVRGF